MATGASLTSPMLIVTTCVAIEPSVLVARTVTLWLALVSKSSEPLTVTSPELLLIAKRPPALSLSE